MFVPREEILARLREDSNISVLDGDDYGLGKIEAMEASINLISHALIKLGRMLESKGVITTDELITVFDRYSELA